MGSCVVLKNVYTIYVDMLKDDRAIKRYSENFKLKVLSEIEHGRLNKTEACRVYGMAHPTLLKWIKKYSKFTEPTSKD